MKSRAKTENRNAESNALASESADTGDSYSPVSGLSSPVLPKPWWQSRSIIGSVIVIVASLAGLVGWSVDSDATTEIALEIAALAGSALAIYGRIQAEQPIRRVRKALPVDGAKARYKFPKTGGCVQTSGAVAGLILMLFLLGLVGVIGSCESRASREEMSFEEMMWRRDAMLESQVLPAITFEEFVDRRSFIVRLLDSVRVGLTGNVATNGVPEVLVTGGADF